MLVNIWSSKNLWSTPWKEFEETGSYSEDALTNRNGKIQNEVLGLSGKVWGTMERFPEMKGLGTRGKVDLVSIYCNQSKRPKTVQKLTKSSQI